VITQRPSDPGFSNLFTRDFENVTSANQLFEVRLHVFTVDGCDRISARLRLPYFPVRGQDLYPPIIRHLMTTAHRKPSTFLLTTKPNHLTPPTIREDKRFKRIDFIHQHRNDACFQFFVSNTTQSLKDFFVPSKLRCHPAALEILPGQSISPYRRPYYD